MKIVIQSAGEVLGTPHLHEVRTSRQLTLIPKSVTTEARSLLINVRLLAYSSIKKQARLCEMTMLYVCTASLPFFYFGSNRLIFYQIWHEIMYFLTS